MRILLVEDNPADIRLFKEVIHEARVPEAKVQDVPGVEDACAIVSEAEFDVAFLDLGLPDAHGLPALNRLRRAAEHLPIVVLTGRTEASLGLDALWNGAQDYVLKDRLAPDHLWQTIQFAIQRKRAEESMQRREQETHHARKLEAIGQLAAGIAHEINTPMQYIGDNLQFLQDSIRDLQPVFAALAKLLDESGNQAEQTGAPELLADLVARARAADVGYLLEELPSALTQSLDGVERVTRIVRAMKEFSHPGIEDKRMVDISKAIESTLTVCRSEWKYVAEVATEIAPDVPAVPCFPGDLNQVFLNLIVNAAHAIADKIGSETGQKGRITVRASCPDEQHVEIRIEDTGTGIPESVRSKVFEPFFTTKDVGKGTGQGLAVAYNVVVEKHGGTIDVLSEEGQGTTFVIRLPLDSEAGVEPAVHGSSAGSILPAGQGARQS